MSKTVNFSSNQIRFIDWLALPKAERKPETQDELAQEIGVRPETLSRWKREKDLTSAVTARARALLGDDLNEIYGALRKEAKAGSFQHIKLALEVAGEYSEKSEVSGKVDVIPWTVDEWQAEQVRRRAEVAETLELFDDKAND